MTQQPTPLSPVSSTRPPGSPWLGLAGLSAGALLLSACSGADLTFEWDVDSIDGSGTVTTEVYAASDFTDIEVCCDLDVRFEIADGPEKVEIAIDDNLHQHLDIKVEDGDLEIKPKRNTHLDPTSEVIVTISGYEIDGLSVDTSSNVTGEFPATDSFWIQADTDANVSIEVDTDVLDVSADTSADVVVSGRADVVDADVDTDADVDLLDLVVVDARIKADTSANVDLAASGTVTGSVDTDADLHVWGDATIDVETDTGGKVHREG